jgi:hypothetical protein
MELVNNQSNQKAEKQGSEEPFRRIINRLVVPQENEEDENSELFNLDSIQGKFNKSQQYHRLFHSFKAEEPAFKSFGC